MKGCGLLLINCTNHPLSEWSDGQIKAAAKWGEIKDFPFPQVSPFATSDDVNTLAESLVSQIIKFYPNAAIVQGEMTLCYALVSKLKDNGIPTFAATSERKTVVKKDNIGNTIKTSLFEFATFREY